jgi:hypothetical protein
MTHAATAGIACAPCRVELIGIASGPHRGGAFVLIY